MIEIGLVGAVLFVGIVAACSVCGVVLSSVLPWSIEARQARLPLTTGIAFGPFLLGFGGILALTAAGGASHLLHLGVALAFVTTVGVGAAAVRVVWPRQFKVDRTDRQPLSLGEWSLVLALGAAVVALLAITLLVPLIQNDALEYGLAARELYFARDLHAYPVLNPESNLTGFYGPWTHPPLYVVLLYLADVIQGHADVPGAIRLIAPWFLWCGAGVVWSLGRLVDRATALMAALLFMSTPLLFLGAGSALIDALPVVGFALVVAGIVGFNSNAISIGAVLGVLLGASLWTHSQAVLFAPLALAALAFDNGVKSWFRTAREAAVALAVALAIAGWPYWRNTELFGTPISDNPVVFALAGLHWSDYFTIGRGLGSPTALVQYGVLKGLFALETYGLIFWLVAGSIVVFLGRQTRATVQGLICSGARLLDTQDRVLWLMILLICCYVAGTILSVALGIDHFVKNERYLLITLPMVSVVAAFGVVQLSNVIPRFSSLKSVGLSLIALMGLVNVAVFTHYAFHKPNLGLSDLAKPMRFKTAKAAEYELISAVDGGTDAGRVLTLKPADFYYSRRKMLSYLDPRMVPFYDETDLKRSIELLREIGVTSIHVPSYGIPPLYNSVLFRALASPEVSTLRWENDAGQYYQLRPEALVAGPSADLSPDKSAWTIETKLALGGRKMLSSIASDRQPLVRARLCRGLPYDLFHRHWINVARVERDESGRAIKVDGSAQYVLKLKLFGSGFVRVLIEQLKNGAAGAVQPAELTPITTFELSDKQQKRDFEGRFTTHADTDSVAIALEGTGSACIEIQKVTLTRLTAER